MLTTLTNFNHTFDSHKRNFRQVFNTLKSKIVYNHLQKNIWCFFIYGPYCGIMAGHTIKPYVALYAMVHYSKINRMNITRSQRIDVNCFALAFRLVNEVARG